MSQHNLSTVALQTIDNYRHAAESTVKAYRTGGHRLIDVLNQRLDTVAAGRAQKFAPKAAKALHEVRGRVSAVAGKGIDNLSGRTDQVIAFSADGVAAQVTRLAELANGVDSRFVADGLQAAARLSLPGAELALALSARVAEGADVLSAAVAGRRTVRAKAQAAGKAVVRKAGAARKATVKAKAKATKAVKSVRRAAPAKAKAVVKAPARRAARAVKAAVAQASA